MASSVWLFDYEERKGEGGGKFLSSFLSLCGFGHVMGIIEDANYANCRIFLLALSISAGSADSSQATVVSLIMVH